MKTGISVILLAYKEEDNLKVLLPRINGEMENIGEEYEIIVVDTQTPFDGTEEVCINNGAKYVNQREPYFGGAFRTGIEEASLDKFLIMDSDCSHDPQYIPDIYNLFMKGADVVIGSRYVKGGATNDSKLSIIMSRVLNNTFCFFLGFKAKDISTDFRMYKTGLLKKTKLTCNYYDVLQEVLMQLKMVKPDLVIGETPISFNKRLYGETKRDLLPFIASYIKTLLRLTIKRIKFMLNPDIKLTAKQLFLYGIIGIFAALIEFCIFYLLNNATPLNNPVIANIIGASIGFLITFSMNTYLNFKKANNIFKRFLSYFCICIFGMALSSTIIYFLKDLVNLNLLKICCMLGVAMIQFTLNKIITFRK